MVIVGLGNPGPEYARSRHNVGWLIVDRLASDLNATTWKTERGVLWSKIGLHWLLKPAEYMNHSGQSLQRFAAFKKIPLGPDAPTELFVVHGEIDFPEAVIKIQTGRSSAGHNGVQSIVDAWNGWTDFSRLRFGIGDNRAHGIPAEEYVLKSFSPEQWAVIEPAIDQAVVQLRQRLQV